MTHLKLKFVHRFLDRHGRPRHYFRRPGFKLLPLPGLPGSEDFMAAYQAALAGAPVPIGESRTLPGTINAPLAEPLAEILAATNVVGTNTFLVTDYGRPFTPAGFGGWFRERCDEAGLHHCTAHGLRKAFLRRMAEAGCSKEYIASISGHRNMDEIRTYVRAANKARMADAGMKATLAKFPSNKS